MNVIPSDILRRISSKNFISLGQSCNLSSSAFADILEQSVLNFGGGLLEL